MNDTARAHRTDLLLAFAPAVFVLLWSSGFIAAKAGLADAETLTYLSLRYAIVTVLMTGLALVMRAPWPKTWAEVRHIATAGVMLQAIYFAGSWLALGKGVGAGTAALIVCLQPVITAALVGPLLGERVARRLWLGLALGLAGGGLAGAGLVVSHKLSSGLGSAEGVAWAFVASLACIVVVLSLITMILLTTMIQRREASRRSAWLWSCCRARPAGNASCRQHHEIPVTNAPSVLINVHVTPLARYDMIDVILVADGEF
ncbi:MAG: DMT family transporter [Minwuia sp.]|nr:DMT family transporter [Minwuia sp.]